MTESTDQAVANPERHFKTPEDVLSDASLTHEEKLRVLDSWALDEEELCRAEEENMPAKTPEIPHAVLLQRIHCAKLSLEDGCQ